MDTPKHIQDVLNTLSDEDCDALGDYYYTRGYQAGADNQRCVILKAIRDIAAKHYLADEISKAEMFKDLANSLEKDLTKK